MDPSPARQPKNLLGFHRKRRPDVLADPQITVLTEESKLCLQNLSKYRAPKSRIQYPRTRLAAVLVALFVGRKGDLYVLLSRRSSSMRTYAGDTSLPGGKVDPTDKSLEDTARREAFEEIGLPRDPEKVPLLCVLEPFLAAELIVTPVVVLILDKTLQPILNASEVASLFSHPLVSFLSTGAPPSSTSRDGTPDEGDSFTDEVPYYRYFDYEMTGPFRSKQAFRVHQFLTGREAGGIKPVFGLTAGMLIRTATIGYGRQPSFDVNAPGAPSTKVRIAWALLHRRSFVEACEREGVDMSGARAVVDAAERQETEGRRRAEEKSEEEQRREEEEERKTELGRVRTRTRESKL